VAEPEKVGHYQLGDWRLAGGSTLYDARLGYAIWGTLNRAGDNLVVLPSYYTGTHASYAPLVGPGYLFDTRRFCVAALDCFGNGVSTSPSNAITEQRGQRFPAIQLRDAVAAQYQFVTRCLGAREAALVAGWSMGGMQAYQWAADYPDFVQRLMPWCATAACCEPNQAFLTGVRAALTADPDGWDGAPEQPQRGLRAFGRVYCGWAYSEEFFRQQAWRQDGYPSREALFRAWEDEHLAWDAHDLLAKLDAWSQARLDSASVTAFESRLAGIQAPTISLPAATDAYFPPPAVRAEIAHIPNARCDVVDTIWGHVAGGPGRHKGFHTALQRALAELLAT